MTLETDSAARERRISGLMFFFALAYFAEGIGQAQGGLINQPLTYYLKQVYHWTPLQVSAVSTVIWLPWMIKPLYGIVSDFLPLFGYRRRYYLTLSNALASIAFLFLAWAVKPASAIFLVMLTAYGMAIASTLYGALLVESGHDYEASGSFVNQQYLWLNIAQVGATLLGGLLIEYYSPVGAMHAAALLSVAAPLGVAIVSPLLVVEKRVQASMDGLKNSFRALLRTFTRKELYAIAGFIFFYALNPGIGQTTVFYYFQTDNLKFGQGFIGALNSIQAGGWILGALLYRRYLTGVTSRTMLNMAIAAGVIANLSVFFYHSQASAVVIGFLTGMGFSVSYVATIGMAADFCPSGAEGFAFAILMSVNNLAYPIADNMGSYLYEHVFHNRLQPMSLLSAAATAICFLLVPMLKLGSKRQGQAVLQNAEAGPAE